MCSLWLEVNDCVEASAKRYWTDWVYGVQFEHEKVLIFPIRITGRRVPSTELRNNNQNRARATRNGLRCAPPDPDRDCPLMVRVIDHAASCVQWRVDMHKKPPTTVSHKPPRTLNNARTPIDCILELTDRATGESDRLSLGAPCKTEYVGVATHMWMPQNADMLPILGDATFLQVKTYQAAGMGIPLWPPGSGIQPERMFADRAEAFDAIFARWVETDADALPNAKDIVDATLEGRRLAIHATFELNGVSARLDMPVKCINVNERDWEYQVDSGPIIVPFEPRSDGGLISMAQLAFVASNRFDYAEFLVRTPTDAGGGVLVHHYTTVVKADWQAEYFALR